MSILKSTHTGQVRVSTQELPVIFAGTGIHHHVFTDDEGRVFAKLSADRGVTIPITAQTFPCRPVFEGNPKVVFYGFVLPSHFEKIPIIEELYKTTADFKFSACEFSPDQFEYVWNCKDHIHYSEIYIANELSYDDEHDEVVMEALKERACYTQKFLEILVNQGNEVYVPERLSVKYRGIYRPADQWFGTWPYEWKKLQEHKLWIQANYAQKIKERKIVNELNGLEQGIADELQKPMFGKTPIIAPNKLEPLFRNLK